MRKYLRALILLVLTVSLFIFTTSPILSQIAIKSHQTTQLIVQAQAKTKTSSPNEKNFSVTLDGETLFSFSSIIEGIPAQNRAQETSNAIEKVAKNFSIELDSMNLSHY